MHFQFWFKFSAFWLLACTFILNTLDDVQKLPGGGGGGGYSVGFLRLFGLKTDIDFAHFGLESGMVFKGTTRSV